MWVSSRVHQGNQAYHALGGLPVLTSAEHLKQERTYDFQYQMIYLGALGATVEKKTLKPSLLLQACLKNDSSLNGMGGSAFKQTPVLINMGSLGVINCASS